MPCNVFLSFEQEDIGTVRVFREHMDNEETDYIFYDYAAKAPFDSDGALDVRSDIEEILEKVAVTVVLIGRTTYADKWVDWEVRTSAARGKGLLGVMMHPGLGHIVPRALKDFKAEVLDLDIKDVTEAIERLARKAGGSEEDYETF